MELLLAVIPLALACNQGQDAQLQTLVARLVGMANIHQVAAESDVPAQLASLGIEPAMNPSQPSAVFSVRRHDATTETDYYFLYNQGNQANAYRALYEEPETAHASSTQAPFVGTGDVIDLEVTFEGTGYPYLLDANSGTIRPIAEYTSDGEHVTFSVKLARDQTLIVAISNEPGRFGVEPIGIHVLGTTADDAVPTADGGVAIRMSTAGTFETHLSDGSTVQTTVDLVPASIDLTQETWQALR